MPRLAKRVNSGFSNGFAVFQTAKKRVRPESQVWTQGVVNADGFDRFKARECRQLREKAAQQSRTRVLFPVDIHRRCRSWSPPHRPDTRCLPHARQGQLTKYSDLKVGQKASIQKK
jgi:hypothetical protein